MLKQPPFPTRLTPAHCSSLFYLFLFSGIGSIMPFINVHFSQLGLTGRQIGTLAIFFPLFTLVVSPIISAVADKKQQRRRTIQLLAFGFAITIILLGFQHTFVTLLPFVIAQAFFLSSIQPLGDGLTTRMTQRHQLDFGSIRLWGSVGIASGGIIFGALWQQLGFANMFFTAGALFLGLMLISGWQEEETEPVATVAEKRPFFHLLRQPIFLIILLASFLVGVGIYMVIIFEGIYAASLGSGEFLIGLLVGLGGFSEIPSMRFSGQLTQRWGIARLLLVSYLLFGLALFAYSWITVPWLLLPFAMLRGASFGFFFPATVQLVGQLTPPEWTATAQAALMAVSFGLAPLLAGPAGGFVLDRWGAPTIFIIAASAAGLAGLLLWLTAAAFQKLNETPTTNEQ